MSFKQILAATCGLALTVGLTSGAMAAEGDRGAELDPNFKGVVNVDVIENNNMTFIDRIKKELADKPAPQVGQTRAAIEAMYGPSQFALAPGKDYEVFTNEYDVTDGKLFRRSLNQSALRVYEVTYNTGAHKSPNDKATDVKLRVIPRVGDHKNLITKLLGEPTTARSWEQNGQRAVFSIPKERFVFFNDVVSDPFEAINFYFNADGFVVGQEFMPANQGGYVLTSTGRYVEFDSKWQPDRKIGY